GLPAALATVSGAAGSPADGSGVDTAADVESAAALPSTEPTFASENAAALLADAPDAAVAGAAAFAVLPGLSIAPFTSSRMDLTGLKPAEAALFIPATSLRTLSRSASRSASLNCPWNSEAMRLTL